MGENTERTSDSRKGRLALGRGLDALLPRSSSSGLREVELDRIEPNRHQPRRTFDAEALSELAASIRENGVVQPVVVTAVGDDRYQLVVGERRWQAAKLAGLEFIPVVVKDVSERQLLEMALVENVQRADLNAVEEALAYQQLIDDFALTQQQVASQVGKSRVAVANKLRLLALPEEIVAAITVGQITEGHARPLLTLPGTDLQLRVFRRVVEGSLSVRRTEELVRQMMTSEPGRGQRIASSPDVERMESTLARSLGTKVALRPSGRGGKIVIEYYSEEEFETLYQRLLGE